MLAFCTCHDRDHDPIWFVCLLMYFLVFIRVPLLIYFRNIKPAHVSKEPSSLVLEPVTNGPIKATARNLQSQCQANAYVPTK